MKKYDLRRPSGGAGMTQGTAMAGRIFITGDKHGTFSPFFGLAEKNELHADDVFLIAGDAGYVWDTDYGVKIETLQQLFPGTVAFIDGNHENHALLAAAPIELWNGGQVHRLGERVVHLMRGELYTIHGQNIFTFGGARSVDVDRHKEGTSWWIEEGRSWWPEEEPTAQEIARGEEKLREHLGEIDYIITHETPLFARASIARAKEVDADYALPEVFDRWYRMAEAAPKFKKWYFGHMHVDQLITPKLRALYSNVLPLGEEERIRWF